MKYLYLVLIGIILSSCVSYEEIRAKQAARDYSSCVSKGFKPNTDTFRLCLDNRSVERIARDAKSAAEDAEDAANDAKLGASLDCIRSGGTMVGNSCM